MAITYLAGPWFSLSCLQFTFDLSPFSKVSLQERQLQVTVWHHETLSKPFLGCVHIDMRKIMRQKTEETVTEWYNLQPMYCKFSCVLMCICVRACVCVCVCVCVHVGLHACVCLYVCFVGLCACMCVRACVRVCVPVYLCVTGCAILLLLTFCTLTPCLCTSGIQHIQYVSMVCVPVLVFFISPFGHKSV